MKSIIRDALGIIKTHRRAYITINAIYYGLVAIAMVVVAFIPEVQQTLMAAVGDAFSSGPLAAVGDAYLDAEILKAIALTFFVNLIAGSFLFITLPSLVIPFSGLLMGIYRAILWGLLLSPINPDLRLAMIPHSLTLILEGQAYILAMFAVYVHGRNFLWPATAGAETRREGYKIGFKKTLKLYVLVILTLAIAAIYEVIEVILFVTLFS